MIRALRHFDAQEAERALALTRTLRGVTIRGNLVVLADTAARNSARRISCPLPFEWQRHNQPGTLKMNFTRGCPYECSFCPNHQGRRAQSCGPEEMWSFTERAAADALVLPAATEKRIAELIQAELCVETAPRMRPALNLLLRDPVPSPLLQEICEAPSRSPATASAAGRPSSAGWRARPPGWAPVGATPATGSSATSSAPSCPASRS